MKHFLLDVLIGLVGIIVFGTVVLGLIGVIYFLTDGHPETFVVGGIIVVGVILFLRLLGSFIHGDDLTVGERSERS